MLTVNGTSVESGSVNTNYAQPTQKATWLWPARSLWDVGDSVTLAIKGTTMMVGTVKSVIRRRPSSVYEYMAEDILQRPVEYWFAPTNLDEGYRWSNINHLNLTKAILAYANITSAQIVDDWTPYPTFQFATGPEPFKITTASAWDVITQICQITGMFVYSDTSGLVHLSRIWDEPAVSPSRTFTTGDVGTMKTIEWYRSDENLRNRVVVYGYQNAYAEASASSPYVPAGVYRTAIISYESIVDTAMAQETANINLSRLNKLTESVVLEVLGDTSIHYLDTVELIDTKAGVSGNWFVYQCEHKVDTSSGYTVRMTCSK